MNSDDSEMILSKGIDFNELFDGGTEFHIDINNAEISKNVDPLLYDADDTIDDFLKDVSDDESNLPEILKNLELSAQLNKLSTPEYKSFSELSESMVDCLSSGDVKLLIIEEGDGPLVPSDAVVYIHYAAYWENELTPFDATDCDMPKSFRLGANQSLPGLEVGLTMVHGPTARFYLLLTPKVSWGPLGVLPRIKPETALFVVQLLEVRDVGAVERFNDLPSAEQAKFSTAVKTVTASNLQGKAAYQINKFKKALKCYHKSLSVIQLSKPETKDECDEKIKWLTKVYINLAVCYYKLNQPTKVLLMCDELGRKINTEKNSKCMFYYAKAFQLLGDYEKSMKYFNKALKIEPNNKDIGKAMAELQMILNKSYTAEKEICSNMFGSQNKTNFQISDEIKQSFKDVCEEINSSANYTKLELPSHILQQEKDYVKSLVENYKDLIFIEDGKRNFIMKKSTS